MPISTIKTEIKTKMIAIFSLLPSISDSQTWFYIAGAIGAIALAIGFLAAAASLVFGWRMNTEQKRDTQIEIAKVDSAATERIEIETAKVRSAAEERIAKVESESREKIAGLTTEAERAKAERAEADKQIAIAKADAARAKEGMADAEARSLEAQRRAAEASAKAESFRLDIAKANERAAEANRIAEEEKLARVKIEERLADRNITDADAARIIAGIRQHKGREFQVVTYWDDREPLATTQRLADILVAAGWKLNQPKEGHFLLGGLGGIQVFFHPEASAEAKRAAEALVSALNSVGLYAVIRQMNAPGQPTEKININVGTKPK